MIKKTKLFSALFAALLTVVLLAACNTETPKDASSAPSAEPAPSSASSEAAQSAPEPDIVIDNFEGDVSGEIPPEILNMDMLAYDGYGYLRADTYPGADGLDVSLMTKGDEIMKVTSNDDKDKNTEGYASVLPVGTVIYGSDMEGCLIAETDGEDIAYIQVSELSIF